MRELTGGLRPLALRVRLRWLLEWLRVGLVWGLSGAAALALAGRLAAGARDAAGGVGAGWDLAAAGWEWVAFGWGVAALLAAGAYALAHLPGIWAVARAADGLGLAERVTSALHAQASGHPAAPLLADQAARAVAALDPGAYALIPRPRRWHGVGLAALALAGCVLAPLPGWGAGRDAARVQLAAVQRALDALQADRQALPEPEPLARATAAELDRLSAELAAAREAAAAARALEQAQERLAGLTRGEDFARQQALSRLAELWSAEPYLGAAARALAAGDPQALQQAWAQLQARLAALSPAEQQQMQLALQAGANAARGVPDLAGALRRAAAQVAGGGEDVGGGESVGGEGDVGGEANAGGEGNVAGENAGAGQALAALGDTLRGATARAAALAALQQALGSLGELRAALGSAGMATGMPAGMAAGGASGPAGAAAGAAGGEGAGAAGGASGAAGGASGGGSGAGDDATGGGAGAGAGGGIGSGSGSGTGTGAGGGVGGGAGRGGGPTSGQPGAAGGVGSGGDGGTPGNPGASVYVPGAPSQGLSAADGPRLQVPGDAAGAGGDTVVLPESPVALGALRPYQEVYGQYEAAARRSLARQPLPPALQGLVHRYFAAVAPAEPADVEGHEP